MQISKQMNIPRGQCIVQCQKSAITPDSDSSNPDSDLVPALSTDLLPPLPRHPLASFLSNYISRRLNYRRQLTLACDRCWVITIDWFSDSNIEPSLTCGEITWHAEALTGPVSESGAAIGWEFPVMLRWPISSRQLFPSRADRQWGVQRCFLFFFSFFPRHLRRHFPRKVTTGATYLKIIFQRALPFPTRLL